MKTYFFLAILLVASVLVLIFLSQQPSNIPPNEPGIVEVPPEEEETIFCAMDAKQCPDGSFVGREPPDCSFSECPTP